MPAIDKLLVDIATNASTAKKFRENPLAVINNSNLSPVEESVLLSRDPKLIQSTLHAAALKNSLKAADGETVWTVVVVI
ncbi:MULTISPECIES: hypothetical protein [Rhizobium]|uniref:Uncharacterized protein n=1 Tax=Rhizobium wuzhouense TaxID=1986026 RepID=A0ABX5P082_9HYPH|nr:MULTISPECIES: hypothetical protein [Rhizobium]PYB77216.1 hypothetical protein DMY87_02265 [Rhizobium wuzhouense]RKE85852.1 hypothetical protein DFO46_2655 [Rhizobium sp. AG855]